MKSSHQEGRLKLVFCFVYQRKGTVFAGSRENRADQPGYIKLPHTWKLTLYDRFAVGSIVADLLDVSKVDVAEEDAVGSSPATSPVVKRERNDVLHVLEVLERPYRRIQVVFVRQVDTLENGALRVEEVAVVVAAATSVLGQHAVSAGTCALLVATVETELLTPAVVVFAHVCSCKQT